MYIRSLTLILLLFFLFTCNTNSKFSKAELAEQDTAWQAMFDAHDEVMPLTLKDIPEVAEELEALAESAMVEASDFHPRAKEAITALNAADEGMQVWMKTIGENQKSKLREGPSDHAAIMAFINEQTDFITKVAKDTHASLKAGRALIATRKSNSTNE